MSENTDLTRRDGGTRRKTEDRIGDLPPELNAVTEAIIGAAIEVHRNLGPGLLEKLYVQALQYELKQIGLDVKREHPIVIEYKSIELVGQRLDLLVNSCVVIEAKAVERVHDVHLAQLVSYLRSGKYPVGLLINFNVPLLKEGLYRRVNQIALNPAPASPSSSSQSSSESSPPNPSPASSSPRISAPSAFKESSSSDSTEVPS